MKTESKKSLLYNFTMELILGTNPGHDLKCQVRKLRGDLINEAARRLFYETDNKRLYSENSDLRKSLVLRNATIKANELHIKQQEDALESHSARLHQQRGIISQLQSELEAAKINADKWIAQRERIKGKAKNRRAKVKEVKTTDAFITIDEITMPIELHDFLIKERVLRRFVRRAKACQSPNTITDFGEAFIWESSMEGQDYWSKLDAKYQQRKEADNGIK